ncbi:hypothetical protein LTS16_017717 [Friedmanniomyces endolithicus]|nr:hypothetical protein LTR57_006467 [Friedmanniomyces endolithicus]KAK1007341.1 hypothetical protein LTS01_002569 [Friedmanniomyces endolithicus]KAK1031806.1 hypothetical protein LTS16_017717 [Friedmanniomyces endolithicus]
MLKTHKPRGHFWTCPSLFQQSKEIRNLSLEDFTPPAGKVLAPDSDDELQPQQRAAKRRRVERLAEDFLNGQLLVVSCVRPHPSELKGSIQGNERARTSGPYVLPAVEPPDDAELLWANLSELYDSPRKEEEAPSASKPSKAQQKVVIATIETVTEEQASSTCLQARQVKIVKLSMDPSADAVEQAAALRARRLQKVVTETLRLPSGLPNDNTDEPDVAEITSEENTAAQPRRTKDREPRSTEWLLRRQTRLYELSADESLDELNRSRVETPSRPSQLSRQANSGISLAYKPAVDDANYQSSVRRASDLAQVSERAPDRILSGMCEDDRAYSSIASDQGNRRVDDASQNRASFVRGSSHTAHEVTGVERIPETAVLVESSQGDSPTRLLRRQGIHAAPPRSWTAANETTPAKPSPSTIKVGRSVTSPEASVRHVSKMAKSRRGKSAGSQTVQAAQVGTRRRSAPTAPQELNRYTIAQTKEADGTPFMFRKRTATIAGDTSRKDKATTRSSKQRQSAASIPSQDGQIKNLGNGKGEAELVAEAAPILDLSFGNDSFVPKLNLALTDTHLNAVLPSEPNSARRSSAIKRAIRRELEDSGADILRVDDEPASSQVEEIGQAHAQSFSAVDVPQVGDHVDQAEEIDDQVYTDEVAQTQWPGTQALLYQAHEDFFRSPDKAHKAAGGESAGTPEPGEAYAASAPQTVLRDPLGILSQEAAPPLPSTQAMVEAWSPWSPVKKPTDVTARVIRPSPTTINKRKPSKLGGHSLSFGGGERRRSSLRFSTSAIESSSMQIPFTVTKAASLESGTKQSGSFLSQNADPPSIRLPVSVNMAQPPEQNRLSSPANHPTTPRSIVRRSRGSPEHNVEDEMSLAGDSTAMMQAGSPGVLKASVDRGAGPIASSVQYAQRSLFRDDSNVEDTVDELTLTVLGLENDGLLS